MPDTTTAHRPIAPHCFSHFTRVELVDYILTLLQFDQTGEDADEAMALMRWNDVTGDEMHARRTDPNRPIYRRAS